MAILEGHRRELEIIGRPKMQEEKYPAPPANLVASSQAVGHT